MVRALAIAVVAALIDGCAQPPAASPSSSASPIFASPSAAPSEAPSPSVDIAAVSLEPVFQVESAELYAIAAGEGGYVAGGCRLSPEVSCQAALLIHSPDGRTWTEVALPGADGRRIVEVARTPLGWLALGSTMSSEPPLLRAVWRSGDGTTWEPYSIPAPETIVFEQVIVLTDRTVFLGADYAYDLTAQTIAWATVDGSTWTSGTTPVSQKVAAHPGLVAVGRECIDVCEETVENQVYRSVDGFEWTHEDLPDDIAVSASLFVGVRNGRALLGGGMHQFGPSAAVLWHDDFSEWRPTLLVDGATYWVTSVVVIAGHELVLGRSDVDGPLKSWWSSDAETYVPVEVDPLNDPYVVDSAGQDPLVLIIGYSELWIASF